MENKLLNRYLRSVWSACLICISLTVAAQTNRFEIGSAECIQGETVTLPVGLKNESEVQGGQLTLLVPEGVKVSDVSLNASRANGHTIDFRQPAGSQQVFIMFYATPNRTLSGNDGTLFNVVLDVPLDMVPGSYGITTVGDEILAYGATTELPVAATVPGNLSVEKRIVLPESVSITCREGEMKLTPQQKELHLSARFLPEDTTDPSVTWSLIAGNEWVTLSDDGVLSVKEGINMDGVVRVGVVANANTSVTAEIEISVEGFIVKATSIVITAPDDSFVLTPEKTSLQLAATVLPENTTDKGIVWTLVSGEELVTLSEEGLVSVIGSKRNGTALVRAASVDGSGVFAEQEIVIRDFIILGESVQIVCQEPVVKLTPSQRTLHLSAVVLPEGTTDKSVEWSILSGEEFASVSEDGVLSVKEINVDGMVKVGVSLKSDPLIQNELEILVEGFIVKATSIVITAPDDSFVLTPEKTSLQLAATVLPENTTDKGIVWTLISGEELVTLSEEGLVSVNGSKRNGTALVRAASVDGSGVSAEQEIVIRDFIILGESVRIVCQESVAKLTPDQRTLHLSAVILPEETTDKSVVWSIVSGVEFASVSENGVLSVKEINVDGMVKVGVSLKSAPLIQNELEIPVEGFIVKANSIVITAPDDGFVLTPEKTSLQLAATVLPENTTDKGIVWTLISGEELVTLSEEGLVSVNGSKRNGTALVRAASVDGSGVSAEQEIVIRDFIILGESVRIVCQESVAKLTPDQRTLHLSAVILPEETTDKSVEWSILSGEEFASVSEDGVLSVKEINVDGMVKVGVSLKSDPLIQNELEIPVEGFIVKANSIVITAPGDSFVLTPEKTSLQLSATVLPENTTDKRVVWSLTMGESLAAINEDGELTAQGDEDGTIVVRATSVETSDVYGEIEIEKKGFDLTGVEKHSADEIYLYVSDGLHVGNLPSEAELTLYSIEGKCLKQQNVEGEKGVIWPLDDYPSGVYLLLVKGKTMEWRRRFVNGQ